MTRQPVNKVLAKIAEAKQRNIYTDTFHEQQAKLLHMARIAGLEYAELLIKSIIGAEQFEEETGATSETRV